MESPYSKSNCIKKAAGLAMGYRLDELHDICDNQKTISTRKLRQIADRLHEEMKLDAIFLREISKQLDS